MRVPKELLRYRITVRDYEGSGARGAVYGVPRVIRCQIQPTARVWVERDNTGISQDIDALIIVRPEDGPVRVESIVTTTDGSHFRVIRSYAMPDERRPSQWELAVTRYAVPGSAGFGSGGGSGGSGSGSGGSGSGGNGS